jgi:PAS domain S-box-containing protein
LDNALNGLETANFEFSLFTKTNQRVYILLNATTRRDVSGAVVGMIGVGQDITEQKQAAMEKTRVAHEMKTFIDTANAPIFGIDCKGLVTEWNNKAAEITQFSREEVLGKDLVKVYISIEYRESVQLVLSNALQGQVVANFEFPLYTKDNRRVEVILNATPRTDVSGRIVGVLGVGQDITERKQVEKEKTRIAAELLTLIDSVNAPIFGVDEFGRVNEWNNKSAAITGFAREEVVGKNFVEVTEILFLAMMLMHCDLKCPVARNSLPWSTGKAWKPSWKKHLPVLEQRILSFLSAPRIIGELACFLTQLLEKIEMVW